MSFESPDLIIRLGRIGEATRITFQGPQGVPVEITCYHPAIEDFFDLTGAYHPLQHYRDAFWAMKYTRENINRMADLLKKNDEEVIEQGRASK